MSQQDQQIDLPIIGGFEQDNVIEISSGRTLNFYPVFHKFGKKQWTLNPVPGTQFKLDIPGNPGPWRGSVVYSTANSSITYCCVGNALYSVNTSFSVMSLGPVTFSTSSGFVRIVPSQNQIMFCDGVSAIIYTISPPTLAAVTFPTDVIPADLTYMDSFFVTIDNDSNNFYVSAQDNGGDWTTEINSAQIDTSSNFGVGCIRLKRRLFLFGNNTTEVWLDAGSANLPFRRDDNLLFEHGLESVGSLVEGFDRVFYLSRNKYGVDSIKMIEGSTPVNISTYEINKVIQGLSNTNLSIGSVYKIDGIIFYKITIDQRTFVYNVTLSTPENPLWHEEPRWGLLDGIPQWIRNIENTHIFFNGNHYIGDYRNSNLYLYSSEFFSDDGISVRRERETKVFSDEAYKRIMVKRIQLDMLQGVGIVGRDSINIDNQILYKDQYPKVELQISIDGGITWSSRGFGEIGPSGFRTFRTYWNQIGNEFMFIFRFIFFNSVPLYILGGAIFYRVGTGI